MRRLAIHCDATTASYTTRTAHARPDDVDPRSVCDEAPPPCTSLGRRRTRHAGLPCVVLSVAVTVACGARHSGLPRVAGELSEIASMVCFIASKACSFTTGFIFDATGGRATY